MAKHPFHQLHVYRNNAKWQRPVTDCYRLLYCRGIWEMARGSITQQPSNQIYPTTIEEMVGRLKKGAYCWINHPGSPYAFQKKEINLLQQAVVIILQSVYADVLTNCQKQLSLTTAITRIKGLFKNKTWCITGEIDFSKINSQNIFQMIADRIKDHRFIKLVQQLFKHATCEKDRKQNELYQLFVVIGMAALQNRLQQKLGRHNQLDTAIYKNHITIAVSSNKKQARWIKGCLLETIQRDLHFHFAEGPTLNHLEKSIAYFGYRFKKIPIQRHEIEQFKLQDRRILFYIPKQQLQKIASDLQYGDYMAFKPARRTSLMNHTEHEIMKVYNKEMRELAAYYYHADNHYCLMKLRALAQSSFLKTVSAKRKTTPKKISLHLTRPGYRGIWIYYRGKGNKKRWMSFLTSQQLSHLVKHPMSSIL